MKQLRLRTLLGVFLVSGVLAWAGARLWHNLGSLPAVPVLAPVVLGGIAAVLLATALSLRSRLKAQRERRPGARGVEPMLAARAVLFGQASALVGALAAGVYGGTGLLLLTSDLFQVDPRRDQALYAGLSVVAAAGVVAVALWLQHICRLPEDEDPASAAPVS
ncbi:DUF3180 domain-containing protein [Streptomyces chumphonensis]|uniref:DUF3180 domain-containing protein n=1 Tax=Streptomyces chumphonensis TaxID=1214925 RepID=A0A927EY75_9ACTN|nr:DUF3180 domain-containing protein [Streptomyces chumphonensis]MBD3932170.1 DUF3180 domain-containing protein [Streptomyces chumphonensis]